MIFVADVLLCFCCLRLARSEALRRKARSRSGPVYPALWAVLALGLGLLALQGVTGWLNLITDSARHDAVAEGWYGERRPFQWLLIKTVPVVALAAGLGSLWSIRKAWRRYVLVVAAILYWASYTVIQGISFHNVDWLLAQHTAGIQNKTWGDLVGLALTAAALLIAWQMDQRRGLPYAAGWGEGPTPQAGNSRQHAWTAGQNLPGERQIFSDWLVRYRMHRRRRALRPKTPQRKR